jgi:hypothetical protein
MGISDLQGIITKNTDELVAMEMADGMRSLQIRKEGLVGFKLRE